MINTDLDSVGAVLLTPKIMVRIILAHMTFCRLELDSWISAPEYC